MVGSTTAGAWTFVSSDCCVVLIDVCDGPIPRPDESYRVCVYFTKCEQVQQGLSKPAKSRQKRSGCAKTEEEISASFDPY